MKHTFKLTHRLLSTFAAIALLLGLVAVAPGAVTEAKAWELPAAASATSPCTGDHAAWTPLGSVEDILTACGAEAGATAVTLPAGQYYLTADVKASFEIKSGSGTVDFCLNGHCLSADYNDLSTYFFRAAAANGTLNICDCAGDGNIQIVSATGTYSSGEGTKSTTDTGTYPLGVNVAGATLNLFSGKVHDSYGRYGEVIAVGSTATINMYDGFEISDNWSPSLGTVELQKGGKFNMFGGKISGNSATAGAGVDLYSEAAAFNMYGGEISGNVARNTTAGTATNGGGAVRVNTETAVFNMYGGTITGNESKQRGGGVKLSASGAAFKMYGGEITGNTAASYGGGLDGQASNCKYYLYGGTISGNVSTGQSASNNANFYSSGYVYGTLIPDGGVRGTAYYPVYVNGTRIPLGTTGDLTIKTVTKTVDEVTTDVATVDLNTKTITLADDATIRLACNEEATNLIWADQEWTLDLNGHTMTIVNKDGDTTVITNNGTLTVTDSSEQHDGVFVGNVMGEGTVNDPYNKLPAGGVAVTGVTLNKTELSVAEGGTGTLKATVEPTYANDRSVTWTSDNEAVATVDGGVVTAVGVGTANVTVTTTDGGFTASCAVTVTPAHATGVTLNAETLTLLVGRTGTLIAAVAPENAVDKTVTWTSDNEAVATVTDGVVTAVSLGTANITATTVDGGLTAVCAVTVTEPVTVKLISDCGMVYLDDKWVIDETCCDSDGGNTLPGAGESGVLDLNGYVLSAADKTTMNNVYVEGDLTIRDTSAEAAGKTSGYRFYVRNGGVLTLEGGAIADSITTGGNSGAGVHVNANGTFIMTGGAVKNNTSSGSGGGVSVTSSTGTVRIEGGEITGNSISNATGNANGGGINATSGTLLISGGTITGNSASPSGNGNGGGVYANGSVSFTMSGGTVAGNSCKTTGRDVTILNANFTMTGGTIGNSSSSTGLAFYTSSSSNFTSTISGGTVAGILQSTYSSSATGVQSITISGDARVKNFYSSAMRSVTVTGGTFGEKAYERHLKSYVATGKAIVASGDDNYPYMVVDAVAVTGVALDQETLALNVGGTATLTATVSPAEATDKTVAWTSDNEAVATVADGVVTAVAAGTATITATTTDGSFTATCAVTVSYDGVVVTSAPSAASVTAGGTIDVVLTLEQNPGVAGGKVNVSYDPALQLTAISNGTALNGLSFVASGDLTLNPASAIWNGTDAVTGTGTMVTFTFTVPAGTAPGAYAITLSCEEDDFYDDDLDDVQASLTGCTVTVTEAPAGVPGDLSGDGKVNAKDIVQLQRFVAGGYELSFELAQVDLNKDGKCNAKDIVMLQRFVAGGYDVVLS